MFKTIASSTALVFPWHGRQVMDYHPHLQLAGYSVVPNFEKSKLPSGLVPENFFESKSRAFPELPAIEKLKGILADNIWRVSVGVDQFERILNDAITESPDAIDIYLTALLNVRNPTPFLNLMISVTNPKGLADPFFKTLMELASKTPNLEPIVELYAHLFPLPDSKDRPDTLVPQVSREGLVSVTAAYLSQPNVICSVKMLAALEMMIAGTLSVAELKQLLSHIDFNAHPGSSRIASSLLRYFSQDEILFTKLATALNESMTMFHVIKETVPAASELPLEWVRRFLLGPKDKGLPIQRVVGSDEEFFLGASPASGQPKLKSYLLLNLPFVAFARHIRDTGSRDPVSLLRIVAYVSSHCRPEEQISMITTDGQFDCYLEFREQFDGLRTCLGDQDPTSESRTNLYSMITEKLIDGAKKRCRHSSIETMRHFSRIMGQILEVVAADDYFTVILGHRGPLGEFLTSEEAIQDSFQRCFKGSDPTRWQGKSWKDAVESLYFFIKYPVEEYERCYTELNRPLEYFQEPEINALFHKLREKQSGFVGFQAISDLGFKILHHNQVLAVHSLMQQIKDPSRPQRFFMRIGTGQGKSVILALLAAEFAKQGKRVVIYTCLESLAERDYAQFKGLYHQLGITSVGVQTADTDLQDAQVLYTDIDTYYRKINNTLEKLARGEEAAVNVAPLFSPEVVYLLDEFDTLVLESNKVGRRIQQFNGLVFNLPALPRAESADAEILKYTFTEHHPGLPKFFERLTAIGLEKLYPDWHRNEAKKNQRRYSKPSDDDISKKTLVIGDFMNELEEHGEIYGYPGKINPLLQFGTSKICVGVSGSISNSRIDSIKTEFSRFNGKVMYHELPPFYLRSGKNREIAKLGNLPDTVWEQKTRSDVLNTLAHGRPILMFAKPLSPDWTYLETLSEGIIEANSLFKSMFLGRLAQPESRSKNWGKLQRRLDLIIPAVSDPRLLAILQKSRLTTDDWAYCRQKATDQTDLHFQKITSAAHTRNSQILDQTTTAGWITLSTAIGGRGVDYKASNQVNARGGLHVLVTDCENNVQTLEQEIGRTGRWEAPGSHSILLKKHLPTETGDPIHVSDFERDFHEISRVVLTNLVSEPYNRDHWQRWLLLSIFLLGHPYTSGWPVTFTYSFQESGFANIGEYIWDRLIICRDTEPVVVPAPPTNVNCCVVM